jgi:hypothetical protein
MSSGLHVESAQVQKREFPDSSYDESEDILESSTALPRNQSEISKEHLVLAPARPLEEASGQPVERCLSNQDVRQDA